MLLKSVVDCMTKTYITQRKQMGDQNLTEQDLIDLDSELVSIEGACKSLRSLLQGKRALGIHKKGGRSIPSIKLIGDENGN